MLFFSRAKLLLTGEYLVMLGAKALALPLKFNQSLAIEENDRENVLYWMAMEKGTIWFEARYNISGFEIIDSSDLEVAANLCKILKAAREINPDFLRNSNSVIAKTDIDFHRQWGLGTSSTLISNIAWWANIDPFKLHWKVSEGSGYDIACARATFPIVYSVVNKRPFVEKVDFSPVFSDNIYFLYLGKKQNTAVSIQPILKNPKEYKQEIDLISVITSDFLKTTSIEDAKKLIDEHEKIIGSIVKQIPVKKSLFREFPGAIKSLGAWGGDFIMVLSDEPFEDIRNYFKNKGLETIFAFRELI